MNTLSKKNICAVVTTFNPKLAIVKNIKRILPQVDKVIVVDDTGECMNHSVSRELNDLVVYVQNEENYGIAKSLNLGFEQAKKLGYDWVITLDDDTEVADNYISTAIEFIESGQVSENVIGLLSLARTFNQKERCYRVKRTLITSGCIQTIKVFEQVGGFNDALFIDLVDFDYSVKIRAEGKRLIEISSIGMKHKVGDSRVESILGFKLMVYNHAPFRLYYQMRNIFAFFKANVRADPALSAYLMLDIYRIPFKALFFEDEKKERIKFIIKGFVDGILGRTGRI